MKYNELLKTLREDRNSLKGILEGITIKNYIPFNEKYFTAIALAENILDINEKGIKSISWVKFGMIKDILLLKYTNIEKEGSEYTLEDYDFLNEVGFFKELDHLINDKWHEDYNRLTNELESRAEQLVEESKLANTGINNAIKNTVLSTVDKLANVYTTKEGKKTINDFLKSLNNNPQLLDTVNNIMYNLNLDKAKDLLFKKVAEIEQEQKEEKSKNTNINKVTEDVIKEINKVKETKKTSTKKEVK